MDSRITFLAYFLINLFGLGSKYVIVAPIRTLRYILLDFSLYYYNFQFGIAQLDGPTNLDYCVIADTMDAL